jgi:hypothetical protein
MLLPWSPPVQIVVVLAVSFGLLFSTAEPMDVPDIARRGRTY